MGFQLLYSGSNCVPHPGLCSPWYLEDDVLHTGTSVHGTKGGGTSRLQFHDNFKTSRHEKPVQHTGDLLWRGKFSMLKGFSHSVVKMKLFFRWLEYRWRSSWSVLTTRLHMVWMWLTWWQLVPQASLSLDFLKCWGTVDVTRCQNRWRSLHWRCHLVARALPHNTPARRRDRQTCRNAHGHQWAEAG